MGRFKGRQDSVGDKVEIAKLIRALELSRTISVIAQPVMVVAGIPLLAVLIGKVGFEPVPVISVVIALGIGIPFSLGIGVGWR